MRRRLAPLLLAALLCAALAPATAGAVTRAEALFRFGSGFGPEEAAAGKLQLTEGIVGDPLTGHIYVAGFGTNNRISEFTPWGEFIKAFGWDVASGAVNEVQELRIRASEGSYKLTFGASTTADLPFNAKAAEVQAALNGLASIGGAGGSVSVKERVGAIDGTIPFVEVISFGGTLAGDNVAQVEAANGGTPLGGGNPSTVLEARTRADGTPGGTGLESCTGESGCQAGLTGGGSGQVSSVPSLAVDGSGNVYAREEANHRVQKFSPSGRFIWMIGGGVNKTKVEEVGSTEAQRNLCTVASGDVCQAGTVGVGKGQFAGGFGVAVGSGGIVYVSDKAGRIQRFNPSGEYVGDLPDPSGVLSGKTVRRLAADPKHGRLYVNFGGEIPDVYGLSETTGAEVAKLIMASPETLATDPEGDLYAIEGVQGAQGQRPEHVVEFAATTGKQVVPSKEEEEACEAVEALLVGKCEFFGGPEEGAGPRAIGTGPNGDLYIAYVTPGTVSYVRAFGPPPVELESPLPAPPSIDAQYAASVTDADAQLRAQINPHFFGGALGTTRYLVQYATAACIEAEGWTGACVSEKPAPPGAILSAGVVAEDVSASVVLGSLAPQTAYRYRFVAEGSGDPGVQIVGVGGEEGIEGADAGFTTYASPGPREEGCAANEGFRVGPSAALADCRAYEMVSPLDKEGGEVRTLEELQTGLPATLDQSSVTGDKLAYGAYRAFGDSESSPYTTQYIATRGEKEWSSEGISPPRTTQIIVPGGTIDTEFKFFSEDLCGGWLRTFAEPPLAAGAVAGYSNLYRRELCPEPDGYEALTTVQPTNRVGPEYELELQGLAKEGEETIFTAGGKLSGEAPGLAPVEPELYGYEPGVGTRYLCILPGGTGTPISGPCSAGGPTLTQSGKNRRTRVEHAISADGSRVYWSAEDGSIYLRKNPFGTGAECGEASAPCTVAVAGAKSQYWGAAKDGSRAIYTNEPKPGEANLFEYDAESETSAKIAGKVAGVMGMSEDARRVYFVSEEDLDGGGAAVAGEPNLYRREASGPSVRFIAALAVADANASPSKWKSSAVALEPWLRATRVSADGEEAAFMSSRSLTGYDNQDLASGRADAEVYLYEGAANGGAGRLVCVSCNPAGTRPAGADVGREGTSFWVAGQIPVAENNLHEARALSADGKRLYFQSADSLALGDTNGVTDVYQWEAVRTGGCDAEDPSFVPASGGCVDLISSGHSPLPSEFLEASPNGSDVFFTTLSGLVPQDFGLLDVYDARVEGGLPSPSPAPAGCEGEACQGPYEPPNDPTPASSAFEGAGNVVEKPAKPCAKGKVRRKGRCVAKKHKSAKRHHARHANHNRGGAK